MKIELLAKTLSFLLLLALPVNLSACNIINTAVLPTASPLVTLIAQPVAAMMTQVAPSAAATRSVSPTLLSRPGTVAAPTSAQTGVEQLVPTVAITSPANTPCDLVAPGLPIDVTVSDGDRFEPGEVFSKTWRLINAGNCPWSREYAVVFFSGQPMGMAGQQLISSEVPPGSTVDITVDMVAPKNPGSYQSNWKLRNQEGELFGLGPNGDAPFWVQIEVIPVEGTETPAPLPSITPTLPVFSAGVVNLLPADRLDLDTGSLNLDEQIDVTYQNEDPAQPAFIPSNGARLSVYGEDEPDETTCQASDLGEDTLTLEGVDTGLYVCYRTSQGLPGYLHVIRPIPDEAALSLDFVTWTIP